MYDERVELIQRILVCSGSLFHNLNPSRELAWRNVDLTMQQLKTLLYVVKSDGATSGQIARNFGVGLSNTTGLVDRLAEQDLVVRREDPEDRRITRVLPTPRARALVDDLLRYRNEVVTDMLSRLDGDQLRCVETAFQHLIGAVNEMAAEQHQRQTEEVGA
jgi:DNA-binding MarR family transcriptional regulator